MADQIPSLYNLGAIPIELYGAAISLLAITWIAAGLRAYVRGYMIKSIGWDDWTLIPAIAAFTVQCVYLIKMADAEMHPDEHNTLLGISVVVTDTIAFAGSYALTCVFLKISLGLFFLRIIIERWQRNIIYVALVTNTIYGFVYFALITFGCGDPRNYLIRTVQDKCISITQVIIPASYAHTALNAAVDWTMALLPIFSIWNLNMPRIAKFWAYCLLLLGATGSIVSLIRFAYVGGLQPGHDFFKLSSKFAFYSTIEPGLGIAAVCFATLRPLFKRCLEGARSVTSTSKSGRKTEGAEGSELQMTRLTKKSRRTTKDGFTTFDESESRWSNENEVTVTQEFSVKRDLEKGHVVGLKR